MPNISAKISRMFPPLDDIADTLKVEHSTAKRIHQLMLINHAALLALSEQTDKAVIDSKDLAEAQADLVNEQVGHMKEMVNVTDRQHDAQTIAQNQDVYFAHDDISIQHILEIVNLQKLSLAASRLSVVRLAEIIDALLTATDE